MAQYPRCPNCGNNVVESWLWCRHCGFDPYAAAGAAPPTGAARGQAGTGGPPGPGAGPAAPGGSAGYAPPGSGPSGYGPPGYGPSGYGPPGYGPPGYGPPGYGPPGAGYGPPVAGYGAPGYGPAGPGPTSPAYQPAPRRSMGVVIAIAAAAVILVPVLCIAAVTLLGRSSTASFSRIDPASTIPLSLPPTSLSAPTTAPGATTVPGATTTPTGPRGTPRRLLPGWVDHPSADGSWTIAFPNDFAEPSAPIGPFVGPPLETVSAPLRDSRPAERLEVLVVATPGMTNGAFQTALQRDAKALLGYGALASKQLEVSGHSATWYEPDAPPGSLPHRFTSVIGVYGGDRSFVLVIANGSGTADQDALFQSFADSLSFT